jgi:uncharacterized protein
MSNAVQGNIVWFDLLTTDPQAAAEFYTQVIGWKAQPFDGGPYTMFVGGQGPLGGTAALDPENRSGARPRWTASVYVDDVDAAAAEARRLGGRVLAEPATFPKVGRFATIADPQGATIDLFKPKDPIALHDASQPDEFTWCELLTTDHQAAFAFYSQLFGWKQSGEMDMGPMGQYLIYRNAGGDRDLGGMFTKSKDMPMPPTWFHYVHVKELDATLERATAKGGQVMNGPMEIPGGGRIVQLLDPQGAAFALHEDARAA